MQVLQWDDCKTRIKLLWKIHLTAEVKAVKSKRIQKQAFSGNSGLAAEKEVVC